MQHRLRARAEPGQYSFAVVLNQHIVLSSLDAEHYGYLRINLPGSSDLLGAVLITGARYVTSGITTLSTSLWDASSKLPIGNRTCVSLIPTDAAIPTESVRNYPTGKDGEIPRSMAPQGRDLPTLTMRNIPFGKAYDLRFEIPADAPGSPVGLPVHIWFDVMGWNSQ